MLKVPPDLFQYLKYLKFQPTKILEAGVGPPKLCRSRRFWGKCPVVMVEANPQFAGAMTMQAQPYPDVTLYPVALADKPGPLELYALDGCTYQVDVTPRVAKPPKILERSRYTTYGIPLHMIDDGDFDVALIDIEGSEWWALKHMVSRPKLLALELYRLNRPEYVHYHIADIRKWLDENGYKEVGKRHADGYFIRE